MALYSCEISAMRSGKNGPVSLINSRQLVPGDIIEIPEKCSMPCDVILLSGSCIVNESMLTGESIPIIKNSIPHTSENYDPINDSKYTLYSGTIVVQNR